MVHACQQWCIGWNRRVFVDYFSWKVFRTFWRPLLETQPYFILKPARNYIIYIGSNVQGRHLRGAGGAVAPPPPPGKRKKEKKKEKKRKKSKKRKKERRELWRYVKLLHIKCCFFQFSIVRWHWTILKKFAPPPKKKLKLRYCKCVAQMLSSNEFITTENRSTLTLFVFVVIFQNWYSLVLPVNG